MATLIGLLISTWGPYRLVLYYHPLRGREFWKSFGTVLASIFRKKKLKNLIRIEAALGKKENRVDSLTGVYLLFFGFALQVFGAICWCIDSLLDLNI